MNIRLPGRLLKALVRAGNAVASSSDERQILRNVMISVTEAGLEIRATDTIVGLRLFLAAGHSVIVKRPGRAVVGAQNLLRAVDSVASHDVELTATDRSFVVSADGAKLRLCVEDANDFPKITGFSERKPFITVGAERVIRMLGRTAFCAHDEPSLQLLHGLLIRLDETSLKMVATDGQRLAVATMPMPSDAVSEGQEYPVELVIPADAASAIKHIIGSDTKTIDIQWTASFLAVRSDMGEVSIRTLSGSYPPYGLGVPQNLTAYRISRLDLIEILRQATAIKSPTANFVTLKFTKDKLVFSSTADGAGGSEIDYDFPMSNHDDQTLTLNPDLMLATLSSFSCGYVLFERDDAMTPIILREESGADEPSSYCVYAVVRQ